MEASQPFNEPPTNAWGARLVTRIPDALTSARRGLLYSSANGLSAGSRSRLSFDQCSQWFPRQANCLCPPRALSLALKACGVTAP